VERAPQVRDDEYADLVAAAAADFNIQGGLPPGEVTSLVIDETRRRLGVVEDQLSAVIGFDSRFFARVEEIARDTHHALHETVIATLKPLLTAYYPSQIMQAITDGPILIGVLTLIWLRPRKPGVVGAWFLIVYALLRVLSEFFRQPDAGVSLTLGLSRGQLLSVLMFVTGWVCLYIASRRDVPKVGGLLRAESRRV
jgi:prolipoprotein diacylglyceryltransferase